MTEKCPAVYILSNYKRTVLYTGVTSNLIQRIWQHKQASVDGFAKRYKCSDLIYFEQFEDMENAILREKQIKGKTKEKKLNLIKAVNPDFHDLYSELI